MNPESVFLRICKPVRRFTLDSAGRETSRAALRKIMAQAQASRLLTGRPAELAEEFAGLFWRDLMVSLLLGVAERPTSREIAGRARHAAAAFLQLHPAPKDAREVSTSAFKWITGKPSIIR